MEISSLILNILKGLFRITFGSAEMI